MTILDQLQHSKPVTDEEFNTMYSVLLQGVAEFHFSPVNVAIAAAEFLAPEPGRNILDIGSGAGKFCMIGSAITEGHFTGIEQREKLHELAIQLTEKYQWPNVHFRHANIVDVPFDGFDGIYYFNSFFEHVIPADAIDDQIEFSRVHMTTYTLYVKQQLASMPPGTRLVTYFSYANMIPWSYENVGTEFDGKMIKWIKRPDLY